jgi:predicted extracellular nuclease
MKIYIITITLFALLFCKNQGNKSEFDNVAPQSEPSIRFMFYNVENLFDTYDDSLTLDNDFLPEGNYHWTKNRFSNKINKIYKVIAAVGGWKPPDVIGLCEIENRYVLEQLTQNTPLLKHNYKIIHKNSPDRRGIDVGLLYNPEKVVPIKTEFIKVHNSKNKNFVTRDILYFKCLTKKDTLHFFINHWPSRWGGQYQSEPKRILAASILKHKVDSVLNTYKKSKIIIAGDFNDTPEDKSIVETLKATTDIDSPKDTVLYNLSINYCSKHSGTHKYREEWSCLDQIIVSGNLLLENGIKTNQQSARMYNQPFLMEEDTRYNGNKPFRTYIGMKYNGGFSDHLPIYLDLFYQ